MICGIIHYCGIPPYICVRLTNGTAFTYQYPASGGPFKSWLPYTHSATFLITIPQLYSSICVKKSKIQFIGNLTTECMCMIFTVAKLSLLSSQTLHPQVPGSYSTPCPSSSSHNMKLVDSTS